MKTIREKLKTLGKTQRWLILKLRKRRDIKVQSPSLSKADYLRKSFVLSYSVETVTFPEAAMQNMKPEN